MDDLHRRVLSYGSRPVDPNEDEALRDLTSQANLYNQEANNIAVFKIDEIKVLQRKLTPFAASDLAPLEARSYLDHFDVLVERPGQELQTSSHATLPTIVCLWLTHFSSKTESQGGNVYCGEKR